MQISNTLGVMWNSFTSENHKILWEPVHLSLVHYPTAESKPVGEGLNLLVQVGVPAALASTLPAVKMKVMELYDHQDLKGLTGRFNILSRMANQVRGTGGAVSVVLSARFGDTQVAIFSHQSSASLCVDVSGEISTMDLEKRPIIRKLHLQWTGELDSELDPDLDALSQRVEGEHSKLFQKCATFTTWPGDAHVLSLAKSSKIQAVSGAFHMRLEHPRRQLSWSLPIS